MDSGVNSTESQGRADHIDRNRAWAYRVGQIPIYGMAASILVLGSALAEDHHLTVVMFGIGNSRATTGRKSRGNPRMIRPRRVLNRI